MTPREVAAVCEGARWRADQQSRLLTMTALNIERLHRTKRLPSLRALFGEPIDPQSPAAQRAVLATIAASMGRQLEVHERPVI